MIEVTTDVAAEIFGVQESTFRAYVTRGRAPQPVRRVGATPVWDRRALVEANSERLRGSARRDIHVTPGWVIHTATLESTNAWGEVETVRIEWIPEEITGWDGAAENVGQRHFAFEDSPPARIVTPEGWRTGYVRALVDRWAGTTEAIVEFRAVEDADDLEPGTFRVLD